MRFCWSVQLVENAAYTFELMLKKAVEENPETAGTAVEKAKHRVLKVSPSVTQSGLDFDMTTSSQLISVWFWVSVLLTTGFGPSCSCQTWYHIVRENPHYHVSTTVL